MNTPLPSLPMPCAEHDARAEAVSFRSREASKVAERSMSGCNRQSASKCLADQPQAIGSTWSLGRCN